ncbi:corticotropin-releasing factor receptor 1 [Aplysia californica]|uniref:Corticotropin-releasing factor receptor 1 n=1 Tax=Aplysia californica TaxID=6500 RepID=A0ABM1VTP9_APLCA|nr:corticotropin-releasing factor receptor 1 [Aplysia californica]
MFIIYAPVMITLLINLLILMNLVRIVIAKLCSGNQTERRRICRAMKSTIVLVFLLGIINLMFFLRPDERSYAIVAYRYINAILPPCQGIFVCLLYCVMNNEVRRAVKKWWHRFRDSRSMHNSTMRRRSSRTSMTMFVSNQVQCNGTEQPPVIELQAVNGHGTPLLDKHGAGLNGRED